MEQQRRSPELPPERAASGVEVVLRSDQRDVLPHDRAFLVALERPGGNGWSVAESLEELARLAETAGASVVGWAIQRRERPEPDTLFGHGKVAEWAERRAELGYDLVISDEDLSPAQQRTLEKRLGVRVIDRTGLILAIFAQRARTREARLQVELARLEYLLPRLAGAWSHLERQAGGIGGRGGPGESQIELDRRQIRRRIATVRHSLEQVRAHRARIRAGRRAGPPVVALVGYTNAGKSTLFNRLTGAGVLAENKLFATLDPTARRLALPGGGEAILTDTVGFVQKLPHGLVAAFRATLEELADADLLLHVVDAAHPAAPEQVATVEQVLRELELADRPRLMVLNKVDLLDAPQPWWPPEAPLVSALTGRGLEVLRLLIADQLARDALEVEVEVPYTQGDLAAQFRREALLIEERYGATAVRLRGRLPRRFLGAYRAAGVVRRLV